MACSSSLVAAFCQSTMEQAIQKEKRRYYEDITDSQSSRLLKHPFRYYFAKYRRPLILGIVTLLLTNGFSILAPLALKAGIDAISLGNSADLYQAVYVLSGLVLGETIFRYLWRIYFGNFGHTVAEDLRYRIYAKLTTLGPSYFTQNSVGNTLSVVTSDVNSFRMAIGPGILILLDSISLMCMIIPSMILLSWEWTWKTLLFLPVLPFLIAKIDLITRERFRNQYNKLGMVSANVQEVVSGIRVIKGFAQEKNKSNAFDLLSSEFEKACNHTAVIFSAFYPTTNLAVTLGTCLLLLFGSSGVSQGTESLGTFVAFFEYIRRFIWPMTGLGMAFAQHQQGRASFDRIREILLAETDIPDFGQSAIDHLTSVKVQRLSFQYSGSDTPALKNISFEIKRGETIGIVGHIGSGKTTLLHLLSRMLPVNSGRILINDIPIEQIKRSSLSQIISYVTQDVFLFSETIADNIALGLGENPGIQPIRTAASAVHMDTEIDDLPEAYDAFLGERGVNLSGGQKQRLTIARALIRRSPMVMLDDSLSAVDAATEKSILNSLADAKNNNPNQIVLIVSHRLASLKNADRILVLQNGEIEAIGTFDELIENSRTFTELYNIQGKGASADRPDPSTWGEQS